jgi:hypothetical protein
MKILYSKKIISEKISWLKTLLSSALRTAFKKSQGKVSSYRHDLKEISSSMVKVKIKLEKEK